MPKLENDANPERQDPIDESIVLAAQAGDHRAANRVLIAYLPMLRKLVSRLHDLRPGERDDLKSEGILALYRAIQTWDPGKVKFAPFAYFAMRSSVTRYLNRLRGRGSGGKKKPYRMVYLDKPVLEDERPVDLPSGLPTPEETVYRREEQTKGATWQQILVDYIETLPGRDGDLVRARYIEGLQISDLAKRYGAAESSIQNWLERALTKVRQDLEIKLNEARINPTEISTYLSARKPHAE